MDGWLLPCSLGFAAVLAWGCEASPPNGTHGDGAALSVWAAGPNLPRPVANNAVVGVAGEGSEEGHVYSFLGIDQSKKWDGVVSWAFRWTVGDPEWDELPPVPGPGRLGATVESVGGKLYLLGGYTVAPNGSEASLPNVDIFDPATDTWTAGSPIPVPVDDAVSGVWRDSLIVLVSGWHNTDNVADVQVYDPWSDSWTSSTPIPGPPVFGHAGGVVGDRFVYLGGANTGGSAPRYRIESSSWQGRLSHTAGVRGVTVEWSRLDAHPGPPRYRAAGGTVGSWLLFAGGTDNPYNYDGMGYDGVRSEALDGVFAFHEPSGRWALGPSLPEARMDHRALAVAGGVVALVGGMDEEGRVTNTVFVTDARALTRALSEGAS